MERVTGIEPAFSAWEADVLPLNYTRRQPTSVPDQGYDGGDASRPFFGSQDLWCSRQSFGAVVCTDTGYYPSDLDGYDISTINGQRALCQFNECWLWSDDENPKYAVVGLRISGVI